MKLIKTALFALAIGFAANAIGAGGYTCGENQVGVLDEYWFPNECGGEDRHTLQCNYGVITHAITGKYCRTITPQPGGEW